MTGEKAAYIKFGLYEKIQDERILYWDAIDIADHLETNFDTWLGADTTTQGILQILGSTVNDKDWDQHVGGKHLKADLSQLTDRDTTKTIAYQWYADDVAVNGATSRDFKLEEHSINSEAIHLVATYTTLSGKQRIATSPTVNQLDWRIFSGGEDGTVEGDNPTPFMETYSFSNSSATHGGGGWYEDGYQASDTHSIRSTTASELGLSTDEGSKILKIAATSGSKRAELGNRNWNTRIQEDQDAYISEKIYLPKEEWDPVTKYSTIIFQHKQYPGADPNFELRLSNAGDYKLYARSPYGHYGLKKVNGKYKHDQYLIATLTPDSWHDLKIHLTPSQDSNKGQITIYLDGEEIFSEKGANLNEKDKTTDSFLKLGMYTQILDDRHYFVDAVEMATFLPSTVNAWVSGTRTDTTEPTPEPTPAPNPELSPEPTPAPNPEPTPEPTRLLIPSPLQNQPNQPGSQSRAHSRTNSGS